MFEWLERAIKYNTSELLKFKSMKNIRDSFNKHSGKALMIGIIALDESKNTHFRLL